MTLGPDLAAAYLQWATTDWPHWARTGWRRLADDRAKACPPAK